MAARTLTSVAALRRIVTDAPVSYSVYSALTYYGPRRGGELPGAWFVAALGLLGHGEAAIRQTLYRMEASHELIARVEGRNKFYRLTPAAAAESAAGLAKIKESDSGPWDGLWTLAFLTPGAEHRIERERLRELLNTEGYAPMGSGLFAHPRDRTTRVLEAAKGHGALDMIEIFRGQRLGSDHVAFVRRHWNLAALAKRYDHFHERFLRVKRDARLLSNEAAFVARFALVFSYLEIAWRDPQLPLALLPVDWPGTRAQELAAGLYELLLSRAVACADELRKAHC